MMLVSRSTICHPTHSVLPPLLLVLLPVRLCLVRLWSLLLPLVPLTYLLGVLPGLLNLRVALVLPLGGLPQGLSLLLMVLNLGPLLILPLPLTT